MGDVVGIIDDWFDYGDRYLYFIFIFGCDGWIGVVVIELFFMVGGDIIELLFGGVRYEVFLY